GFLPSALTAFGAHASRLHFFRKLLRAAPASGLPFLSIALLAHVSCAIAGPIAKAAIMAAKTIPFMELPPVGQPVVYSKNCGSQQPQHITRQRRRPASGPIACLLRHRRESTRVARLAHRHTRARQTAIGRRLPIRRALFDERPQSFLSVGGRSDVAEILHRLANAAPVIEIVDTHESSAPQ